MNMTELTNEVGIIIEMVSEINTIEREHNREYAQLTPKMRRTTLKDARCIANAVTFRLNKLAEDLDAFELAEQNKLCNYCQRKPFEDYS